MPFAKDDTISLAALDGGIDITEQQYADARAAKLSGREALVIGDELVIRDPAPSPQHTWENGEWVAPVEPETGATTEQLWDALRAQRDARLAATDWLVQRHAEELTLDIATTLTTEQYTDLLTYRQALRDLPEGTLDPANPVWPVNPLGEP